MTAQAHTTGQSVTASQNWYSRTPAQVAAAVELGMLQRLLDTRSLSGREWVVVLALSLIAPAVVAGDKVLQVRRQSKEPALGGPAA